MFVHEVQVVTYISTGVTIRVAGMAAKGVSSIKGASVMRNN